MSRRTIYISCAPEDWEATRELREALEAASLSIVARQPDQITEAWRFVACFSRRPDGTVLYDRQELLAAIERRRLLAGQPWLFAVKLQKCHLPVLPVDWHGVPVIEPAAGWHAAVEQIAGAPPPAGATASMTGESIMVGNNLNMIAADVTGGTTPGVNAHLALAARDISIDNDANFTAFRSVTDDRKGR